MVLALEGLHQGVQGMRVRLGVVEVVIRMPPHAAAIGFTVFVEVRVRVPEQIGPGLKQADEFDITRCDGPRAL